MLGKGLSFGVAALVLLAGAAGAADWPMANFDAANTRAAPAETVLNKSNVARLKPLFTIATGGDNWATPVVLGAGVYVTDSGGKLTKVDPKTGEVLWSKPLSDFNGVANSASRVSVAYAEGMIFAADRAPGANVIAIDERTGEKKWVTRLDDHPGAQVTGSPVVSGDKLFVGVSSSEGSKFLANRNYQSTFRGSVNALDLKTGKVLWKTYTVPDNGGKMDSWSGGAVIGVPAVDARKGALYFGAEHLYSQPKETIACLVAAPDDWNPACYPQGSLWNRLTALDMNTGKVKWSYFASGPEVYERICGELPRVTWQFPVQAIGVFAAVRTCPPVGDMVNWGFATGSATLYKATIGGKARDVVGISQKSGAYWAFDADTGEVLWTKLVGPYSEPGGMPWGAAYDGRALYVTLTNLDHVPYQVQSGKIVMGGSWVALNPVSGDIVWQTGDPQNAADYAPPVVANGVVYVGSLAAEGDQMYALDADTGDILWKFAAGASVAANPAVVDGRVYWGSGFRQFGGVAGDKVYVFSLDGR